MSGDANGFKVDWSSRSKLRGPGDRSLGELLLKLQERLAPSAQGISISYVDDRMMRKLNREHRGINQTTDVLSFPSEPEKGAFQHLGDLVISLPVAEKMSKKFGVSRKREIETLVIHGFLHLCGQDHEKDNGEMMALQAELERELLGEDPLPMSLKRGRKPGSKVKVLKDGGRVVVTGRAAKALARSQEAHKVKQEKAEVAAKVKAAATKATAKTTKGKAAAGAPAPKSARAAKAAASAAGASAAAVVPAKKVSRKKRPVRSRSGVIA